MGSCVGERIRLSIFGESHGRAVGAVLDGLPAGEAVDLDAVGRFLSRRAPMKGSGRNETDVPQVLSGLYHGKTDGAPLCAVFANRDARPEDYAALQNLPRPSHADYPAWVKFHGANDPRGGGHFSGRLTAPLCFAGAVCAQLLERRGVTVGAHLIRVGGATDVRFDPVGVSAETLRAIPADFPALSQEAGERMQTEIANARAAQDSVGGVIECAAVGLPVGLGAPMFAGVENRLAGVLFGIPGVRGVEFGDGFAAGEMRGSKHNDPYRLDRDGSVTGASNHAGGVLGGLTTGMPLIVRVVVKPTPSIGLEQRTVDLSAGTETSIRVEGRHDACIAPRATPCVEAATAFALMDMWE